MGWSWDNIDWQATEACGTWAAAFMTAAGVFIAANLAQHSARRAARASRRRHALTLMLLYGHAKALMRSHAQKVNPSVAAADFEQVFAALEYVNPLDLGDIAAVLDLLAVRRALCWAIEQLAKDWQDQVLYPGGLPAAFNEYADVIARAQERAAQLGRGAEADDLGFSPPG
jgi:hypothetical protein